MITDPLSTAYITLAFELEQHIPGLVDAYFGPPELQARVQASTPRPPEAIAASAADMREAVQASDYPTQRKGYLNAQLRALETLARVQAGVSITYRDQVRNCFDIEPRQVDETLFDEANEQLNALLPRPTPAATIAERMEAWKQQYVVSPSVAQQMIERIAAEARHRTSDIVTLPDGDYVGFELVTDKPWSGYNWYLGNTRSRIEINTDLPIHAHTLLDLVCHEAYPGHHAEHALKEQHLYRQRGWGEHSIQLINTPECVISEGIATLAASMIFDNDATAWAAAELYPLAGIVGDPQQEQQIGEARRVVRGVAGNAALLLHEQGADSETVVQYLMRYSLNTEAEARHRLRFISHPLWRVYIFTYHTGRDLLARWLAQGDHFERFRTLLTEQIYPAQVEGWIIDEHRGCLD
ncbi:MAG: hypothetical protein HC876_09630 [Chloroflexaceae bacterium]|nr:hypothetical protein [Chloroflexaceae bacterium]NJO05750.1 hypothetical protein [Chloroflexaceae bacterium]